MSHDWGWRKKDLYAFEDRPPIAHTFRLFPYADSAIAITHDEIYVLRYLNFGLQRHLKRISASGSLVHVLRSRSERPFDRHLTRVSRQDAKAFGCAGSHLVFFDEAHGQRKISALYTKELAKYLAETLLPGYEIDQFEPRVQTMPRQRTIGSGLVYTTYRMPGTSYSFDPTQGGVLLDPGTRAADDRWGIRNRIEHLLPVTERRSGPTETVRTSLRIPPRDGVPRDVLRYNATQIIETEFGSYVIVVADNGIGRSDTFRNGFDATTRADEFAQSSTVVALAHELLFDAITEVTITGSDVTISGPGVRTMYCQRWFRPVQDSSHLGVRKLIDALKFVESPNAPGVFALPPAPPAQ